MEDCNQSFEIPVVFLDVSLPCLRGKGISRRRSHAGRCTFLFRSQWGLEFPGGGMGGGKRLMSSAALTGVNSGFCTFSPMILPERHGAWKKTFWGFFQKVTNGLGCYIPDPVTLHYLYNIFWDWRAPILETHPYPRTVDGHPTFHNYKNQDNATAMTSRCFTYCQWLSCDCLLYQIDGCSFFSYHPYDYVDIVW